MTEKLEKYFDESLQSLDGLKVFITGSTSGIGKEAAIQLAKNGAEVHIHGRNKEKGESLVKKIREEIGRSAEFYKADLSNFNEVRAMCEQIQENTDYIDVIVNNAGGFFRGSKTALGEYEYTFVVNYLSNYLITASLIDHMEESDDPRIIFTSSEAHRAVDSPNLHATKTEKNNWSSYSRSKLYQIMLSYQLREKIDNNNLRILCIHPGTIPGSGFLRNLPTPISSIGKLIGKIPIPFAKSTDYGGAMIIYGIVVDQDPDMVFYYKDFKPEPSSSISQDAEAQEKLLKFSEKVSGVSVR